MKPSDLILNPSAKRFVDAQIRRTPTKVPPVEHIDGSFVESLSLIVPIRTKNPLNNREHWSKVSARGRKEKEAVGLMLLTKPLPRLPVTVQLTRNGKGHRPMDAPDGLPASMKHVMDAIAAVYGLDDADPRIKFLEPKQNTAAKEYGVAIEIRRES